MTPTLALTDRRALAATQVGFLLDQARRLAPRGSDPLDLLGPGAIGLLRALDGYDPARGTTLRTWAWRPARRSMRDSLRADRLDRAGGHRGRVDAAGLDPAAPAVDLDAALDRDRVLFAVAWNLTARQAAVIRGRYGFEGEHPGTQAEVAARLGIARGTVAGIERAALARLRRALGAGEGVDLG